MDKGTTPCEAFKRGTGVGCLERGQTGGAPMEGWCTGVLGEVVGMRREWRRELRTSACTSATAAGELSEVDLRRWLSSTAASSSSAAARLRGPKDSLAALCCATQRFNMCSRQQAESGATAAMLM